MITSKNRVANLQRNASPPIEESVEKNTEIAVRSCCLE
jgi:hypothetical protein